MNLELDSQRLIDLLTQRGRMKGKDIAFVLGLKGDVEIRAVVGYNKDHSIELIGTKRTGRNKGYYIGTPEETVANNETIRRPAIVSLKRCRLQKQLAIRRIHERAGRLF